MITLERFGEKIKSTTKFKDVYNFLENLSSYKKRKVKTYIQRILCVILLILFLMICVNLGSFETLLFVLSCIIGITCITPILFVSCIIVYILLNW